MLKRLQAYLRIIRIFVAVFQDICGCQRFRRRLPCGKIFFRNGQQNLIRKERISGTYAPAEFFAVDHQVQRTVQEPFRKNGRISLRQMNVNMRISAGKTTDAGRQDVGREKIAGADGQLPGLELILTIYKIFKLILDIHDFFGSITFPMVLGYGFPAAYFPEEVRVLLASLCCCRQRLPQGAPTSPALSNLVMKHFDEAMAAWCGPQNIAYTRYCDDMTFSGDLNPGAVIGRVRGFLETMGMELNHSKTAVCSQFSRQTVTGITVNQVCQLPREDRRKLRQEVYLCLRYGTGESRPADSVRRLEQILGKVSYLLQVRPDDRWFLEQREALKEMLKKERGQVYES